MTINFSVLDDQLTEKCRQANIPGLALVACQDGKVIYEKFYGARHVEKKLPVTADTVFGVASITKSFATLAIMQLVAAGKLSVHDPVNKWLPNFKLPGKLATDQVTIHHLMTHTSGLPGLPIVHQARAESIRQDPDGEYLFGELPNLTSKHPLGVADLIDLLANFDYSLIGRPGELFNYSNEGYAFLQKIIEVASGQGFLQYMDEHIFEPLQMETATFLLDDLEKFTNVTELYAFTKDDVREVFHSPVWWDVGSVYTNGSLKTSIQDLMKYLELYRLNGTVSGQTILPKKYIDQMTKVHITAPNGLQYGYGLQVQEKDGYKIVGHGGSNKGISSQMLICQEAGLTVAALTNIADVNAGDIAMTTLLHILGIDEEKSEATIDITTEQLQIYTGAYESLEGNQYDVEIERGYLRLISDSSEMIAKPIGNDQFMTDANRKLVFIKNEAGKVKGLFTSVRFIPKVSS